jgi:hypothetical protein
VDVEHWNQPQQEIEAIDEDQELLKWVVLVRLVQMKPKHKEQGEKKDAQSRDCDEVCY